MARSRRRVLEEVWKEGPSKVIFGRLEPLSGRKPKVDNIFSYVGEKLPFQCLPKVRKHISAQSDHLDGIYMAHDSFGVPRYGGRGNIFNRLTAHHKRYPELIYFSFYIVRHKNHEMELENIILRAAGPQMLLNKVKVRSNSKPGSVRDYEPGTEFYQRKDGRGRAKKIAINLQTKAP